MSVADICKVSGILEQPFNFDRVRTRNESSVETTSNSDRVPHLQIAGHCQWILQKLYKSNSACTAAVQNKIQLRSCSAFAWWGIEWWSCWLQEGSPSQPGATQDVWICGMVQQAVNLGFSAGQAPL